jgi:hypothetical protein
MNQLLITADAIGYTDDYEEQEVHQEKQSDKDPSSEQLTETDCNTILQIMIQLVKEIKHQFVDGENKADNKLVSIAFTIISGNDTYDEEAFFNIAATNDSLINVILEYINVTDHGDEGTRISMPENDSYESHPAGTFAALALVAQDKKHIGNYIDFLKTNDLDHEMMQMWHIKDIVEKYSWCEETARLVIARGVSCCGQSGKEQFDTFVENGLNEYIADAEIRKQFLQHVRNEFDGWDDLQFRLKDGSEKYYRNYVVAYVKHFEKLLTKEEIEQIEIYLMDKWNAYNTEK